MLNVFRQGGFVQALLGGIVLLIIAAFALDFRRQGATGQNACVVDVAGSCVAPRDYHAALRLAVRRDLTAKQMRELGVYQMVVDGLVERELLAQEAERLGIGITENDVDAELALGRFHFSLPVQRGQWPMLTYVNVQNPKTEKFSFEVYKRSVRSFARMSGKDFKIHQTRELTADRMRQLVMNTVSISEPEAFSQFTYVREKATARVAQLDRQWFARFLVPVDEAAVDAFLAQNSEAVDGAWEGAKAKYTEGCAVVREFVLTFPPGADEEDKAKTRALATDLTARLAKASPEELDRLARIHSSAASGASGGVIGCIDPERADSAPLLAAVESLEVGGVSEVLDAPGGLRVLRVERKLGADELQSAGRRIEARPLASRASAEQGMKDAAADIIARLNEGVAMQDVLDAWTKKALSKSATASHPRLLRAAEQSRRRPRVEISASFSRVDPIDPIPDADFGVEPKRLAFALTEVDQVHPEPIGTREGVAILQLKDRTTVTREAFETEKREFMAQVRARAQMDALAREVERLKQQAAGKIDINSAFVNVGVEES